MSPLRHGHRENRLSVACLARTAAYGCTAGWITSGVASGSAGISRPGMDKPGARRRSFGSHAELQIEKRLLADADEAPTGMGECENQHDRHGNHQHVNLRGKTRA